MKKVPARLHVILARQAATAVVIRRGPSKHVGVFEWNRETDTFRLGQWLKGRIYAYRCDLSPDGNYFIYFAMNGNWTDPYSLGSWTAISKAPYLKALTFYPWGDCWNGGGLFHNNKSYWLNRGYVETSARIDLCSAKEIKDDDRRKMLSESSMIYYKRLRRDGWRQVPITSDKAVLHDLTTVTLFKKSFVKGWKVQKHAISELTDEVGLQTYRDEHVLIDAEGNEYPRRDWEWCDLDGDRIVFTKEGKLWAQNILSKSRLSEESVLHDFNEYVFERKQAPY